MKVTNEALKFAEDTLIDLPIGESTIRYLVEGILERSKMPREIEITRPMIEAAEMVIHGHKELQGMPYNFDAELIAKDVFRAMTQARNET